MVILLSRFNDFMGLWFKNWVIKSDRHLGDDAHFLFFTKKFPRFWKLSL